MRKKAKILILTVKWGHLSIAEGIRDILADNDYGSVVVKIPVEKLSDYSYTLAYRFFPKAQKIPFLFSEDEHIGKITNNYLYLSYKTKLEKTIQEQDPDIIINTYFAFNPTLERLLKKKKHMLINAVENPQTFSKLEVSTDAYNLCFDKSGVLKCKSYGVDAEKCIQSGWFVRRSFYKKYNKNKIRKQLGLESKSLIICVIGGSEGSYNTLKILPAFINPPKPTQAIFICGNNSTLLSGVNSFQSIINSQNHIKLNIVPLGYTQNIDEYIKASDLVVGKAGPNLLFETVATKTPFFAISHISGQEDGNLDIIRNYRLGFVEENGPKSIKLLRKIIENPKFLERFSKPLEKMAKYNQQSTETLINLIKGEQFKTLKNL